jgi:hypothetical protein
LRSQAMLYQSALANGPEVAAVLAQIGLRL